MKSIIKSILLIILGALVAGSLLFGYASFIKSEGGSSGDENLNYVEIEPGEAVISHISGEVYLIREEKILNPGPGDAIREGDIIKVVDDSWCQVHFVGKATMSIRSNSLLRIQKLLTSTKDIDIRTELLTGSMIYKVDRLNSTDNLEVLAQEKIYRVEGTEFYIEAFSTGGSRVAVREGTVAVLQKREEIETLLETVPAGQSLSLRNWSEGSPIPPVQELNSLDSTIFEKESPAIYKEDVKSLIFLDIAAIPAGAQIYLDGRLNSKGRVSGLFSPDETFNILARKRGYKDLNIRITPSELTSSRINLKMEPLGLEESLKEDQETAPEESIEELKSRFNAEAATLNDKFNSQILESQRQLDEMKSLSLELKREINKLEGNNSSLNDEKKDLEQQLEQSLLEQEKLKTLLLQIQELSADQ